MISNRSKQTLLLTIFKGVLSILGFAFGVLISKIFGLSFYGHYFKIVKYVQLTTQLSLLGYPNLLARAVRKKERRKVFIDTILISLPLALIVLSIILYFDYPRFSSLTFLVCFVLLFFNLFSKHYEALELSKSNIWRGSLVHLSLLHGIVFIILYITNQLRQEISGDIVYVLVLTFSLIGWIFFSYQFKNDSWTQITRPDKGYFLSSLYLFSGKINSLIITKFDIFLLAYFYSSSDIGLYAIASRIPSVAELTSNAIRANTIGALSKSFEDSKYQEFYRILCESIYLSLLVVVLLIVIYVSCFNLLMSALGLEIISNISLLILFVLPNSLNILFGQVGLVLNVTRNEKYLFRSSVVTIPFVMISMIVGAYFGSLKSFLIGISVAIIIVNSVKIYYAKKVVFSLLKV